MTILAAGGGSGGHVTPVLAVLKELKKHDPDLKVYFITDKAFGPQAATMMSGLPFTIHVKRIYAGKLRRYHGVSLWRHMTDVSTMLKNVRDVFLVGIGLLQSLKIMFKVKPDVVFTKGGFVCLPVGLAARLRGIPLVIHDSDAHPGLTNKILARDAAIIATGAPIENYPYPTERTRYVGIPVSSAFRPLTAKEQQKCKAALGLSDTKKPLVVVTGGGLGARTLNHVVVSIAGGLIKQTSILQITGKDNYQETIEQAPEHVDYIIKPFIPEGLALAFGAADIIVTRAGATTLSEIAAMGKATVLVPNPKLTGGHQLKNAAVYAKARAAVVLNEQKLILNPLLLKKAIETVLQDAKKRHALAEAMHAFAKPDAAIDMAALIAHAAYKHKKSEPKSQ
ncbi:MAG TPA: UDP-N-acetylglucosamine--N-acetylmuramyl-(pentapeptide) pyrophosphoryl-undecaprenol N-acetylglucosamine transferase [Candidatus Saccharimonadales bacterium]|nr:UDP-N-acetylglucosamine--N-acetylmuramyl-(pentapeptide) pyrophosphoryl-undecaprenol N-acetylglucosamine transferase [Candidatus Saccharimonadales bacterium]